MEILDGGVEVQRARMLCPQLYDFGVVPDLGLCDAGDLDYLGECMANGRSGAFAWRGSRNRWAVRCYDHGVEYDWLVEAEEMNEDDLFEVWDCVVAGFGGAEERIVVARGEKGIGRQQFPGRVVIER